MFVSGLCLCIYIYTLVKYKKWNLYVLNRSNKLRLWLIPFHAIWGLFWYISLSQAWCALHFLQFCRGSRCPSFDWNHLQMSKSRDSAKRPDDSCLNWLAPFEPRSGSIDLAFEGGLICHPETKQRSQALGRIWAYSYAKQTLPYPDFDWNIVQSASAPYHQGVWAGQVQVPTKIPLIGMGRSWCYSFLFIDAMHFCVLAYKSHV